MTEGAASTTVFSLSADMPAALPGDFPGDAVLDTAWLAGESGRHACRIARFSSAGTTLCVEAALDPGAQFVLALQNGQEIPGHVGWSTEEEVGFVFDRPMDVVSTLARNLALLPAERRRVPRVELRHAVGIRHGEQFEIGRTRDLSQGGLGVETRIELAPEDVVQIAFDGLRPMEGTVRWAEKGKAGIAFTDEIAWQILMPWLRETQRAGAWRAQLPNPLEEGGYLAKEKTALRLNRPARVREGVRWWNVQVRALTSHHVEFDSAAFFAKGQQLWVWLPGTAGWPAGVIEAEHGHYFAEFRMPLRKHDLDLLSPARIA